MSPLYVAISYFSFKHKRQRLLLGLQERHILITFHVIFGVPFRFLISQNSFWLFLVIFMFNVVERLFKISETIFKSCFTWVNVTLMFISSDVTVNVALINYAFLLTTIWKGQVSLLRKLQLLIPVSLDLSFRTLWLCI